MPALSRHCDVVIVGARAGGAATALLLARLGHEVVVLERAEFPSDTISTHQLARSAMVSLRRWGLLDTVLASGVPPVRQVTFTCDGTSVTHPIKEKSGVDHLIAPRRYVLDTLLADEARRAGATVHMGASVREVIRDAGGRAVGVRGHDGHGRPVEVYARFVVGADGLGSRVARSVGAAVVVDRGAPGATQYAYYTGLDWPGIEFITQPGSYAGVFPTHQGEAAIWICSPAPAALAARRGTTAAQAFEAHLQQAAPELAHRLRHARRTSPVRGMLRAPNLIRRGTGPGWALVGDAAYHRDPITGHGISDAYRDAELLATALDLALGGTADEPDALRCYETTRWLEAAEIFQLTCQLVAFPPVAEFTELTRRLGAAIDTQAAAMAERPLPGAALAVR